MEHWSLVTGHKVQWSIQKRIVEYIEELAETKGVTRTQAVVIIEMLGIKTRNALYDWIGKQGHLLLEASSSPSTLQPVSRRKR